MNFFSILGFFFILAVMFGGVVTTISAKEYHLFADLPAIFLVVGGTAGAAAITMQINRVGRLLKVFFNRLLRGKRVEYSNIIKDLMIIAEAYRRGDSIATVIEKTNDHFLKEGLQMIDDNILKGEELFEVLESRAAHMFTHYNEEATKFKNLGKYPPAFGLMATVLGMIALLSNLGGADAMKMVGPAMGMCLVATFMGIVLANVVILPIGDSLADNAKEINLKNQIIVEGLYLISEKTNPIIVAEKLNSFLLPSDRLNWKDVAA
ncbi:MotA/TolQ/ExbB proton channel family protein [Bacteriovorax sp. PP10]|uniref:MotA/TolQ/ExbB proton channel family protein n=1 Tax=Bacteriovorax antarcticus TaxID=3088717 RepID=A0ABU5VXB0_9BACT|nr:MotA/TolQ/ExbB proton channel family protein [Bacteriovorax sp. PP10]MEA9357693.1 MotA/TolQ/ExbB proton channel family protein [Bacteriovorax sp. PP10]